MVDRFPLHEEGALDGLLVILFEEDGADQPDDCIFVRESTENIGSACDLDVEALDRIGGIQLGAMLFGERQVGQHVGLGIMHDGGELRYLGADLTGNAAPLGAGSFGCFLRKSRREEG